MNTLSAAELNDTTSYVSEVPTTKTTTTTPAQVSWDTVIQVAADIKSLHNDYSWARVAKELNSLGYRTRTGRKITDQVIAAEFRGSKAKAYRTRTTGLATSRQTVRQTTATVSEELVVNVLFARNMTAEKKVAVLTALFT